jgi:hypothetical protein
MKLAWAIGTLAALAIPSISAETVAFNRELAASFHSKPISFAVAPHDLPHELLLGDNYGEDPDVIACTETNSTVNSGTVTVVLAISKCLNASALAIVDQWVAGLQLEQKTYFTGSAYASIQFETTMVPGACQERTEKELKGIDVTGADQTTTTEGEDGGTYGSPAANVLLSQVGPEDIARLESFQRFGHVLESLSDAPTDNVIGVISFASDATSYSEIVQYEREFQADNVFNFQICKSGESCDGEYENCIKLIESVDLFSYNPFTIVRKLSCSGLTDGVPITYVDASGVRNCMCSCPVGTTMTAGEYGNPPSCTPVDSEPCDCEWAKTQDGYRHEVCSSTLSKCEFKKIASDWLVPIPFPTDGYVSDKRTNTKEESKDPRVTLVVTKREDRVYANDDLAGVTGDLPSKYEDLPTTHYGAIQPIKASQTSKAVFTTSNSWYEYQTGRVGIVDGITFTSYGKYDLKLDAFDYYSSATCPGCLAIVDKTRPRASTQCPASYCDSTSDGVCVDTAELTTANLITVQGLVTQFYDFGSKAPNDVCSSASSSRCDDKCFRSKGFFDTKYDEAEMDTEGKTCFDSSAVLGDFLNNAKAKKNPLVKKENGQNAEDDCDDNAEPVPKGQCLFCCDYSTSLKEKWTDYKCGSDYDVETCSGDADQSCNFHQCLALHGDTLVTVKANIQASVVTESKKVIKDLEQDGYQTETQIHRALQCTKFDGNDGKCSFSAKVSDLIETDTKFNLDGTGYKNSNDYVFWRYRVAGSDWKLWKTGKKSLEQAITFSVAQTKIVVEAWTQCGKARTFFFYVHLHLSTDIKVCDYFPQMWYQTSVSRLSITKGICAFPGSDFAEITFDYHPTVGLEYMRNSTDITASKVVCTASIEGRTKAEILKVTKDAPEIVKRFAVEMVNQPNTKASTGFAVSCTFTYKRLDKSTMDKTCTHSFTVEDCKAPEIDTPNGLCEFEACAGGTKAGLYEACSGSVIAASAKLTTFRSSEKKCCQGCGSTNVVCANILDGALGTDNLGRCEPDGSPYGVYEEQDEQDEEDEDEETATVYGDTTATAYGDATPSVLSSALLAAAGEHMASPSVALAMGGALVAAVAVVALRRRAAPVEIDDAYYPLLG